MQDPPSLDPNPDPPFASNASSSATQTTPSFPHPTSFRGSYHRRVHSEVQFRIPDDLDLVSDPFEGLGSEDDLFCTYVDIEKLGGSSKGSEDGGGAAGSSSGGSGRNPEGEEMSGLSGKGEKNNGGGKGRHRYSNSIDGCSLMESIEAKKAMSPDKLVELWTIDPKRAKRIIANRQSAARSKERKARYISELERKVQTLQTEATTLSAQLTLFQRDTTGLTTENTELKLRLQAMEQQAQLRDALNEALKKEVERLKIATGEITTPTDTFNLGMHHMPYNQSSFFPPQPEHMQVDTQNIQMPSFHPLRSNMLTPNQSVVTSSNSQAFADIMRQDPLGRLQGLVRVGVIVKGDEAAPRRENPMCLGGSSEMMKKKRGRPRKYGADGCLAMALSVMPISSSIPLSREFWPWKQGEMVQKSQQKYEIESSPPARGNKIAYFVGANFTPHVITVNSGEDVTMKVMSFSQQGGRAICILSANGTISNVTLRQPTSSGGTLTYEGWFEILSLSGSFMPTENGGTKSRSGGMSISLADPNGHVLGGGLAGQLVAAGPVQVVVASFLPGHQQEQKHKQQRTKAAVVSNTREFKVSYGGVMPILTSASFPIHGFRDSAIDSSKTSSAGEESKGHSLSRCEVSS